MEDIEGEVGRNSKTPFVRIFRDNYEGDELSIYALVEVFSFGIGYTYLESWYWQ